MLTLAALTALAAGAWALVEIGMMLEADLSLPSNDNGFSILWTSFSLSTDRIPGGTWSA